jgi:osmotically-inducible protein OsmY
MRNELAVQQDVFAELAWAKSLEAADIGVAVAAGAATLTGHVRSFAQKRAAEKAAKRVRGVVGNRYRTGFRGHSTGARRSMPNTSTCRPREAA